MLPHFPAETVDNAQRSRVYSFDRPPPCTPPPESFGLRRSKTEELMLDIHTRASAGRSPPVIRDVEFFRIELAPLE